MTAVQEVLPLSWCAPATVGVAVDAERVFSQDRVSRELQRLHDHRSRVVPVVAPSACAAGGRRSVVRNEELSDDDLARMWQKVITASSFLPDGAEEVVDFLRGCVREIRVARASASPAMESAVRCGERVVQHLFLSPQSLVVTLDLLDREIGPTGGGAQERWWSQWRNNFTLGGVSALVERTRQGQAAVHDALQDALKAQGRTLVHQCRAECAATASDAACCGVALLASDRGLEMTTGLSAGTQPRGDRQ